MKHLKTYKLFESNLPYKEITREEYNQLTCGDGIAGYDDWGGEDEEYTYDDSKFISEIWIPFTEKELQKIQELLPDAQFCKIIKTDRNDARIDSPESGLIIIKLIDEWYYVMMNMTDQHQGDLFFQCDQFEGLIKLIKDYII